MQEEEEEEVDSGSESGEMDAGLQMETGAALPPPLLTGGREVLEGGVNCPLAPLSELTSLTGEDFFFRGFATALFCTPVWVCWACWRCLARLFLNQTWQEKIYEY